MKSNRESQTRVRKITREMNISKDKVHRIMRDIIGFKPYMMHFIQQSYDEDMNLHVEVSERLISIVEDLANKGNVFFSDQSNFYVSEMMDKHNYRSWATSNRFMIAEAATNSLKINV